MRVAPLPKVRAELVSVSRRLHENGWVANHDGNISVRLTGSRLLITPTAVSKRDIDESMLITVDMDGKVLEGRRKPFPSSSCTWPSTGRPEAEAVIHAHPPHATAFGLVGLELSPVAMPEIVVSLGPNSDAAARDAEREGRCRRGREGGARGRRDAAQRATERSRTVVDFSHGAAAHGARRALREDS